MNSTHPHTAPADANALGNVVREANSCVERLLELLDDERNALCAGDLTDIDNCVKRKVECVADLEKLDNERARICRTLSLSNSDIDTYLSRNDPDYTADTWENFMGNLQQCRDANAVNGSVSRVRREHIEKALQILRGGATGVPVLYGPDGLDTAKDLTSLGQA